MAKEPHWHKENPWRDEITYIAIDDLAEMLSGGNISDRGTIRPMDKEFWLEHWRQCGRSKLDAYLLGEDSAGVRYGPNGPDYYSYNIKQTKP